MNPHARTRLISTLAGVGAAIAILLQLLGANALAGPGTADAKKPVPRAKVRHLQHEATSQCFKPAGAKLVRQNVVVRRGRVHHLRKGRPFLSHRTGGCEPRPKARLASAITSGNLGCDLSNNDPIYNFRAVRAKGLTYCWLKDIEGVGFHDRTAAGMRLAADGAGVIVGGYDFGHICLVAAATEAHFFAAELKADGLTGTNRLRPALDAEYAGNGCSVFGWVRDWIAQMHREGFPDLTIYAGCFWWTPRVGSWWPDPAIAAWIPGYPNAPRCVSHAITVHQFTDHGNLGAGFGDENVLLGRPDEIAGHIEVIPPDVQALNKRIASLWRRRSSQGTLHRSGRIALDAAMNRIYFLGWQPHLAGSSHDWTLKPGPDERRNGDKVRVRWAKGRHGTYVHRLLNENWTRSHTRVHRYGDVRMRGDYRTGP